MQKARTQQLPLAKISEILGNNSIYELALQDIGIADNDARANGRQPSR